MTEIVSVEMREACFESLLAKIRSVIAAAWAERVMQGYTLPAMADRIGWTEKRLARMMLAPRGMNLSDFGLICFAMDVEPEFRCIVREGEAERLRHAA